MVLERTFVLIKPDAVERGLIGKIIERFENVGLKIVAMKMVFADSDFAKKHYFDVADRHGEKILNNLVDFMTSGPVVAMILEGVQAVSLVRKMVGSTESHSALPGTIRGDFSHHSYDYADSKGISVKNVVHASGNLKDAEYEMKHWFSDEEIHTYNTVHEKHVF